MTNTEHDLPRCKSVHRETETQCILSAGHDTYGVHIGAADLGWIEVVYQVYATGDQIRAALCGGDNR